MAQADELDPIVLDASTAPTIFKPHEYVQIKAEMLGGDWAAIQNTLAKARQGADGEAAEISLQIGDAMTALLQRMIVGWKVDRKRRGLDGSVQYAPLPYSPANVALLPRKIFEYVYQTANTLYQGDEEKASQNFSSGAGELSPAS